MKEDITTINQALKKIRKLKVLIIGEVIIDEYCYGKYLGKMRRKSIMEFMENREKKFLGGAGLVANHIVDFVDKTELLTLIGDYNSNKDFIDKTIDKRVKTHLLVKENSCTPIKKRYIDEGEKLTIFKSSKINDEPITTKLVEKIIQLLDSILDKFDLVIVMDYGHGMLDKRIINKLILESKYLTVNTQINIENRGYNTIDKYNRMDYACINEDELRLVCKDKHSNIEELINKTGQWINFHKISITRGPHGSIVYSDGKYYNIKAYTKDYVVDTMGAGDCYFSISSLFAKVSCNGNIIGITGNIAGAIHSMIEGNSSSINKRIFKNKIKEILND